MATTTTRKRAQTYNGTTQIAIDGTLTKPATPARLPWLSSPVGPVRFKTQQLHGQLRAAGGSPVVEPKRARQALL